MYRAGHQAAGKPVHSEVLASEHDLVDGAVVRQHADHDAAVEQIGNIRRRLEAERRELTDPLGATHICNHFAASSGEIRSHRRAHAETDKSDIARDLGTAACRCTRRAGIG
jgi:hypothetical protein